jgi:D-alanine-D-alanine ligase-like ATP-grasp enzyme
MEYKKLYEKTHNMQLAYYVEAAMKLDIDWKILIKGLLVEFSKNDKTWRQLKSISPLNDSISTHLAMYKNTCSKFLRENDFRIPNYQIAETLEDVKQFMKRNNIKDVVIKPSRGFGGKGITMLPENNQEIERGIALAKEKSLKRGKPVVMVEEFIKGQNYRLLVLGDNVIATVLREPAKVTGTSKDNIELLIKSKNRTLKEENKEPIPIDSETEKILKSQGIDMKHIPKEGQSVYLRINSNMSSGGTTTECLSRVNKYYKNIAIEATKAVGLRLAGVDLITQDITNPNAGYAINEINHNPGIRIHYMPDHGKSSKVALPIQKYILSNL